jgi:hypothetical protein
MLSLLLYIQVVFETDTLAQASPAAVSRLGVVHISSNCLGWEPLVMTWLAARSDDQRTCFTVLWTLYVGAVSTTATDATTAAADSSRQLLFETLSVQLKGTDRYTYTQMISSAQSHNFLNNICSM